MDFAFIVPLLALTTLLIVLVYALISKERVEARRKDPNVPKSTLASDSPDKKPNPPDV